MFPYFKMYVFLVHCMKDLCWSFDISAHNEDAAPKRPPSYHQKTTLSLSTWGRITLVFGFLGVRRKHTTTNKLREQSSGSV